MKYDLFIDEFVFWISECWRFRAGCGAGGKCRGILNDGILFWIFGSIASNTDNLRSKSLLILFELNVADDKSNLNDSHHCPSLWRNWCFARTGLAKQKGSGGISSSSWLISLSPTLPPAAIWPESYQVSVECWNNIPLNISGLGVFLAMVN